MDIYLPIAQLSISWVVVLGMGIAVAFLLGMLGGSSGFITTPLLLFYGIPPGVAVARQASPIAAASLVGAISKGNQNSVDYRMAWYFCAEVLRVQLSASTCFGIYQDLEKLISLSRSATCCFSARSAG
jgi:uncharacterized protein